ncbi:MAG: hypothetical protein BWK76_05490 [Desulfobulbaceae bacterium A2]|nr:MAG: hypothetical protein BWK76_05490 [Desulfobulbaceae bacterium A2]
MTSCKQTDSPARVYWITGLAGAGKTTLARQLCQHLRDQGRTVVLLDGDQLRQVLGTSLGFSPQDRLVLAQCYGRLCGLLAGQGLDVICATISMFHRVREWNRRHLSGYVEIYLKTTLEELRRRDQKQLYSQNGAATTGPVLGLDTNFEEPLAPDVVLENDGSLAPEVIFTQLLHQLATMGANP